MATGMDRAGNNSGVGMRGLVERVDRKRRGTAAKVVAFAAIVAIVAVVALCAGHSAGKRAAAAETAPGPDCAACAQRFVCEGIAVSPSGVWVKLRRDTTGLFAADVDTARLRRERKRLAGNTIRFQRGSPWDTIRIDGQFGHVPRLSHVPRRRGK